MIFADAGGEVIVISCTDEVQGREVGGDDGEIDVDEWRSIFPDNPDDGTSPDPAWGTPYLPD